MVRFRMENKPTHERETSTNDTSNEWWNTPTRGKQQTWLGVVWSECVWEYSHVGCPVNAISSNITNVTREHSTSLVASLNVTLAFSARQSTVLLTAYM